jgi:hypothetical protein
MMARVFSYEPEKLRLSILESGMAAMLVELMKASSNTPLPTSSASGASKTIRKSQPNGGLQHPVSGDTQQHCSSEAVYSSLPLKAKKLLLVPSKTL